MRGQATTVRAADDGSDSEAELAAFCPKVVFSDPSAVYSCLLMPQMKLSRFNYSAEDTCNSVNASKINAVLSAVCTMNV